MGKGARTATQAKLIRNPFQLSMNEPNTQKEKIRTRNEEQLGEGRAAAEVAAAAAEEEETPMQLVFSGGTKEMLEVDAHTLFYVEAEGNYIRVDYV